MLAAQGLIVIPALVLILSAAAAFVYGTMLLMRASSHMMRHPLLAGGPSGLFLVLEAFLVGTALIIAGAGFYQLFVSETWMGRLRRHLPRWLLIRDFADLTARMISILALTAVGGFASVAGGLHSGRDILFLGAAAALVLVALSVFLRSGSDR